MSRVNWTYHWGEYCSIFMVPVDRNKMVPVDQYKRSTRKWPYPVIIMVHVDQYNRFTRKWPTMVPVDQYKRSTRKWPK